MKLNQKLNLVVSIYGDPVKDGDKETYPVVAYVHSVPISQETFSRYYLTLSVAFKNIYGLGIAEVAGPRIAWRAIEDAAKQVGDWEGPEGVQIGLLGEIRRLSNFVHQVKGEWQQVPLEVALTQKLISTDDASEVENAIAFFMLSSVMLPRQDLTPIMERVSRLWGVQLLSSTCTEFITSLKTSTAPVATGGTAKQADEAARSRIPY